MMSKQNHGINIGRKLKTGILWQYVQTIFVTVFNFGTGIILARILDPADFGIFAAVTAFTNILMLQVSFGWPAALLRAEKLAEPLLSTVFWIMEGTALFLTGLIMLGSQYLGGLYDDDRFSIIMILLCLNFIIRPFNIINGSILRWKMRYDVISRIQMGVVVVSSLLGIVMAYKGYGVYSLVYTGISSSLLLTSVMAYFAPWRPKFVFSLDSIKSHFKFSFRLHLNSTLNMISNRIDNMLIGKISGMKSLGFYVKAFSLGRMPVDLLASNLYQMFFTALCHKREDRSDSILMFQKMLFSLTCIVYLPLSVLLLTGESFIVNLYGDKWIAAVIPMQIMLMGSFATIISMISGAFCDSQNLVKQETKVQSLNILLTVFAVWFGSNWGLAGISSCIATKAFIMLFLLKNILTKGIGLHWKDLWHSMWPNVLATLTALFLGKGLMLFFGTQYNPTDIFQSIMIAAIAAAGYVIVLLILLQTLKKHSEIQILSDILKKIFINA